MVTLARLIGLVLGFGAGIILHEYAHAKTADLLGDRFPRMQGRLTLRPKAHADPIGTFAMPALFSLIVLVGEFGSTVRMIFGYGRPVQTNPRGRNAKRDAVLVALAGPAVNIAVAAIAGIAGTRLAGGTTLGVARALLAPSGAADVAAAALIFAMTVNVFILIVNVLPIPPLDGSRVLATFLSPGAQLRMQEYAQYLLLFLIVVFFFLQGVLAAMANPVCRGITGGVLAGCPL